MARAFFHCAEVLRHVTHLEVKPEMLTNCSLNSKWGPRRRGRKLAILPHKSDGPLQVSSLTGISQRYDSYMELNLPFVVIVDNCA